jgi:hypothetical protein
MAPKEAKEIRKTDPKPSFKNLKFIPLEIHLKQLILALQEPRQNLSAIAEKTKDF